jgi:hypothetical protein
MSSPPEAVPRHENLGACISMFPVVFAATLGRGKSGQLFSDLHESRNRRRQTAVHRYAAGAPAHRTGSPGIAPRVQTEKM